MTKERLESSTASDKHDKKLAAVASKKLRDKLKPTRDELAALRRVEKQIKEEQFWEHVENCPKGLYHRMSGRQYKVLNEQAKRYGIPCGERKVNLAAVVKWIHDYLADGARKPRAGPMPAAMGDELDGEMLEAFGDASSPALELYRMVRAQQEAIKLEKVREQVIERETLRDGLARIMNSLRQTGAQIQKVGGSEAHAVWEDGIGDAMNLIEELYGQSDE